MKFQLSRADLVLLGLVTVLMVAILFGLSLLPFGANGANQASLQATTPAVRAPSWAAVTTRGKVIVDENAHPGTTDWQIASNNAATTQIQAYASATSVLPEQKLTFYVSTQTEGTSYSIGIYRLGWYGGSGGRLMALQANLVGHAQGYYNPDTYQLLGCHSCRVDTQIGLIEADWQPSYTLTVPADWTTGVYLAKFTDAQDLQTYAPFDVRGNAHATYLAVTSDTTYAAYNDWGGYSLYQAHNALGIGGSLGRGVKVSFDRPYAQEYGSSQLLLDEVDAIHWLERQGYDLSYASSVDLHEDPAQLLQHRVYLSLGHDEYWSKEMRDGVEQARNKGVGLAFLGANAAYWQMRFEPDSAGIPDRTIVCYKVQTANNDLARDPLYELYGKNNMLVTTLWRDPILARPENALIGIMSIDTSENDRQQGFPWQVSPTAKSPLLDGTGLQPGRSYGCGLVGNEWDRIVRNGATPAGLQVLAASHPVDYRNQPNISNTAYYIAPSGALVFATGSIYWTNALDSYRFRMDKLCVGQDPVVPGMQKLMAHVMDALAVSHPSGQLTRMSSTHTISVLVGEGPLLTCITIIDFMSPFLQVLGGNLLRRRSR